MRILSVGYRVPYPLRDGGNARSYGYLRELGRRHEVSYLCRVEGARPDAAGHLRALCRDVEMVVDPVRVDWTSRVRSLVRREPLGLIGPASPFFRRFRAVLATERFDLVHLAGVDTASLAEAALASTPAVWDLCDCTSRYYDRQARGAGSGWRSLWYRRQASAYRALERRLLGRDLAIVTASPSETRALVDGAPPSRARVHVLPTGVDTRPPAVADGGPPLLVFTGTLDYPPNADAVRYFCREILPGIRRERPDARFAIVGGGASDDLIAAGRSAGEVDFLGFVPDVFETLSRATLFVCPMRQGTGIKVKLLEAMACGLPIVATPLAVEGVPEARDGRDLRVAASASDFVRCVLDLLGDPAGRRALGARAREVIAAYAWERLGERLDRLCRDELALARRERLRRPEPGRLR